jgi:hypothetical protein
LVVVVHMAQQVLHTEVVALRMQVVHMAVEADGLQSSYQEQSW